MDYSILKKDDFITNNWSGGTTTELFIYPKDLKVIGVLNLLESVEILI